MFTWSVFILLLSCCEQCLSYNFFSNTSQTGYLHRVSRQTRPCRQTERLCQSGECYPKRVFCDGVVDCADGSDETSICTRTCSPLVSSTVDIKCTRNGVNVDCSKSVLHDTQAEVSCKRHYHLPPYNGIPAPYNRLICENGVWDFNLLECVPVCGTRNLQRNRRIILGNNAKVGEFPWHVAMFIRWRIDHTKFTYTCGGSIITAKAVITAATCVRSHKTPQEYRVGAGKYYKDWADTNDENAQLRTIEKIHVSEGWVETYTSSVHIDNDMAVVIVEQPFIFGDVVRPICIVDWTAEIDTIDNKTLIEGTIGYVPGWGAVKEDGSSGYDLKFIGLNISPARTCVDYIKEVQPDLKDKICVRKTEGTGQALCQGDRGGGLAVQLGEVYYLMAMVSFLPVKRFCDEFNYTMITRFSHYAPWVHSIIDNIV